jgi:hypothetical protein
MKLLLKILFFIFTVFITMLGETKFSTVVNVLQEGTSYPFSQELLFSTISVENHSENSYRDGENVVVHSGQIKKAEAETAKGKLPVKVFSTKAPTQVSKYTSNLGGPVVQDMVTNSVTGATTGFAIGSGMTAINGGDFKESIQAGWNSAKVGFVVGASTGVVSGFQRASQENVNWLTGRSLAIEGESQTIYRAVSATEKASINSSKSFLLKEGGTEVKYFAKTLEDAHWYGSRLYPEGYSIIQGTVNSSVNVSKYWYPYVDIGAYAFPGNILPYVKPIIP